ncbi:hypothetical protein [Desulfovibrio sp. JC022]|uniref:hypothetical protein n=1 Tax=Desulfovibrio sp. JC022 TaxID=2593642 RepID=UPI0013D200A1|nr:hypothetical protein [Desulfovibrio sp. JC022]NDV21706.1 hypothetical protein [Desulfovibrio sp. JC022]
MVKQHRNNLFNDCDLSVILENVCNSIIPQVETIPEKEFLSSSDSELVENIIGQNSIKQITLHEEKIHMRKPALCRITPAGKVYRPVDGQDPPNLKDGMITQVEIPYSGDKRLLVSRPSMHYAHGGPSFTIKKDRIIKYYVRPLYSDPKSFKNHFLRNYERINQYLAWQAHDIAFFDKKLRKLVLTAVSKRRDRNNTIDLRLAPKPGATEFNPVHVRRKLASLPDHSANNGTPVISDEDFIKAIRVLRHTGSSFERTPAIYSVHNDQDLRNILVSNLNTHFAGENNKDIFKRVGVNGFTVSVTEQQALIGKCTTWHCEEGFIHHLNTLFQEEICRSCKVALAIFNRTEHDFASLLKNIRETLMEHPYMVKLEKEFAENEWHTIMNTQDDLTNHHWVHLMVFNLYFKKKEDSPHLTEEEREFLAKL